MNKLAKDDTLGRYGLLMARSRQIFFLRIAIAVAIERSDALADAGTNAVPAHGTAQVADNGAHLGTTVASTPQTSPAGAAAAESSSASSQGPMGRPGANGSAASVPVPNPGALTAPVSARDTEARTTEIRVRGAPPSRPEGEFRAADMRQVPGTFGDPFQALQAMPGVGGMVSGLPYFYLRGAPPANTGYFIDGIPVPMLFHVGPGPSVVPNGLLGRVEFHPGIAPARYGRFAGGIIAGETRSPAPGPHGEVGARVFDANALVEAPITVSTTGLVAGRYGYPNVLLSLFAPRLSLNYWDYTVRASHAVSSSGTLSVTVFGALDEIHDDLEQIAPLDTQFHRVDLRYRDFWDGGWLRIGTTFGMDATGEKQLGSDVRATARNTSTRFRVEVHQKVLSWAELEVGGDVGVERSTIRDSEDVSESWSNPTVEGVGGLYAELVARPIDGVEVIPGARLDVSRFGHEEAVWSDPRVRARVRIADGVHWLTGAGLAHQMPSYLLPVAGLKPGSWGEVQTTRQISQGIQTALPWSMKTTVTGFYHSHENTTDYVAGCGTFQADCSIIDSLDGRTFGLEVLLERTATRGLSGWLAYTLSRAERTLGTVALLSAFDRTHVFSGVLSYRWDTGYSVGIRGTFYSGRPDIPSIAIGVNGARFAIQPGQAPQHRLPEFYRVDLRAEKRWSLADQRWVALVFDFFNVTLQKEAMEYWCNFDGLCTARRFGPIALPSIGMEAGF